MAKKHNPKSIKQKQYCNKLNRDFKNGPYKEKKKYSHLPTGTTAALERVNASKELSPGPGME